MRGSSSLIVSERSPSLPSTAHADRSRADVASAVNLSYGQPMRFVPSKLFHAVVVTGAALTAGCAGSEEAPTEEANVDELNQAPTPEKEEGSASDTSSDGDRVTAETRLASSGKCPPGSERPFPPCYYIL